jgi:hypothetical protein
MSTKLRLQHSDIDNIISIALQYCHMMGFLAHSSLYVHISNCFEWDDIGVRTLCLMILELGALLECSTVVLCISKNKVDEIILRGLMSVGFERISPKIFTIGEKYVALGCQID